MITQGEVLDIASQAIYTIIVVSAPLLLVSLIIGLIISIFQTVTSIQEQTLTFVPKILAVFPARPAERPILNKHAGRQRCAKGRPDSLYRGFRSRDTCANLRLA